MMMIVALLRSLIIDIYSSVLLQIHNYVPPSPVLSLSLLPLLPFVFFLFFFFFFLLFATIQYYLWILLVVRRPRRLRLRYSLILLFFYYLLSLMTATIFFYHHTTIFSSSSTVAAASDAASDATADATAAINDDDTSSTNALPVPVYLECELYIAESTIPNAGNGIFSGVIKNKNDYIGNGDKAIPIINVLWHNTGGGHGNDNTADNFFNPTEHYVWEGSSMGMGLEVFSYNHLTTFWPGIDAMVNCHSGLLNTEKSTPVKDNGGIHRSKHFNAGSISPYMSGLKLKLKLNSDSGQSSGSGSSGSGSGSGSGGSSKVSRYIPVGGELFKNYGDEWFLYRTQLGQIPVQSNYIHILELMSTLKNEFNEFNINDDDDDDDDDDDADDDNDDDDDLISVSVSWSNIIYEELIKEIQIIWNDSSRTLNALHNDFTWNDILIALDENEHEYYDNIGNTISNKGDMGVLLQKNATRSIEYLREFGKCIDHIINKQSTIDGAGHGGFAKRNLPIGTLITGTPLIHFPYKKKWFNMYDYQTCENGQMVRNTTDGPYGQQLLLNYCFSHPQTTVVVCPYGSGINYINHASNSANSANSDSNSNNGDDSANVKIQWSKNGTTNHNDDWLLKTPNEMMDYSYATHLAFDYIALRDIKEGEELFLDYGQTWKNKFTKLQNEWPTYDDTYLKDYISAIEYNTKYGNDILPTKIEEQEVPIDEQPSAYYYPNNLFIRCHSILDKFSNDEDVVDYNEYFQNYYNNWFGEFDGDDNGYECEILERHNFEFIDNGKKESYYTVQFISRKEDNNDVTTKRIFGVNRKLIKFADKPYTTDLHMIGSFRQPIGIPDDILPDAWRNVNDNDVVDEQQACTVDSEDDQKCQLGDNEEDDPCAQYYDNSNPDNYNTHDDLPTSSSDEFHFYSSSTRSTRRRLYKGT